MSRFLSSKKILKKKKDKLERTVLEGREEVVIGKTCALESNQFWNPGWLTKLSVLGVRE